MDTNSLIASIETTCIVFFVMHIIVTLRSIGTIAGMFMRPSVPTAALLWVLFASIGATDPEFSGVSSSAYTLLTAALSAACAYHSTTLLNILITVGISALTVYLARYIRRVQFRA